MTKQRITISIASVQVGWLQREAKRLGISVSDFIRRIIDEHRLKD